MSQPTSDNQPVVFEYPFEVRQRDVDQFDRITPGALYGSMQDAALAHSAARNLSGPELLARGYVWMLNRIHFVVDSPPMLLDQLRIRTWGSYFSGLYAVREYNVLNNADEVLVRGTSRWLTIHVEKKRAVRMPDFISEHYGVHPDRGLENSFEKFHIPVESGHTMNFRVLWSDLDSNRHANSARYFDWCVDALPHDVVQQARLAEFELDYKRELRLNDQLISGSHRQQNGTADGQQYLHRITADDPDTLIAQARSRWI
ncbi:MAG: acyl-ACP thioesterase domain-containing protein [Candidatus Hydrogenedentota bacterium]